MRQTSKIWKDAFRIAAANPFVGWMLALAFCVPLAATIGQFSNTGFWGTSLRVQILFWPGQDWSWGPIVSVWLSMGLMLLSYSFGIVWLIKRRFFSVVILAGVAGLIVANIAGAALNTVTGWKELQMVSSMDLAGKANRAIFSLWHNPAWEEVVFRGIPLAALLYLRRRLPGPFGWPEWCYLVIPSIVFAVYHIPGHGPSRIVDTFILSLLFGWLALRYTFFAPLILHYIFDAMMVPQLPKMPNIPKGEVGWLSDNAGMLNSAWSISLLFWIILMIAFMFFHRVRLARMAENSGAFSQTLASSPNDYGTNTPDS